jgi:hypothetical protein
MPSPRCNQHLQPEQWERTIHSAGTVRCWVKETRAEVLVGRVHPKGHTLIVHSRRGSSSRPQWIFIVEEITLINWEKKWCNASGLMAEIVMNQDTQWTQLQEPKMEKTSQRFLRLPWSPLATHMKRGIWLVPLNWCSLLVTRDPEVHLMKAATLAREKESCSWFYIVNRQINRNWNDPYVCKRTRAYGAFLINIHFFEAFFFFLSQVWILPTGVFPSLGYWNVRGMMF